MNAMAMYIVHMYTIIISTYIYYNYIGNCFVFLVSDGNISMWRCIGILMHLYSMYI